MWIEITQEDHQHGGPGWEYGTCLWSPTTNKTGMKIYDLMNQPEKGDRVIHFYKIGGKRFFHGTLVVSKNCKKTTLFPPSPGNWSWANEFYRIELESFEQLKTPVEIKSFTRIFDAVLREEIVNDLPKFYPFNIYNLTNGESDIRLSQGKYLSQCTQKLFTLLNQCSELDFEFLKNEVVLQEFAEGKRKERETYFFLEIRHWVKAAKQTYGYKCQACGFDFKSKYGELGEGVY